MIRSNLKPILDERELSIRQVSRDLDYGFETVRKLYNDEMERYPRDLLTKLCDYLEVGIEQLLVYEEQSEYVVEKEKQEEK